MPTPHIGAEAITPVISATGRIQGNSAIPVYVYTSIPSDRRGLGMAAQPVVFINDSDLVENGGQYKLQGRLTALPVIQVPAGSRAIGMPAIPVYDVTNKDWPPAFNPIVPSGNVPVINAIAYYKMDEISGVRHDSSPNGFDLIEVDDGNGDLPPPVTPVASAVGKIGLCATTVDDPNDPSVLWNANVIADLSTGFYVGLWVKINTWDVAFLGFQSSDPFLLFGLNSLAQPVGGIRLPVIASYNDGGTIYFALYEYREPYPAQRIPIADTNWHYCLSWYDPSEGPATGFHLLVDNATEITKALKTDGNPLASGEVPISSTQIGVGPPNFNDNTDAMFIDEVLFASGVPTQAIKDYLWNNGNGRTYPFT